MRKTHRQNCPPEHPHSLHAAMNNRIALLHGAGYTGGELIRLLLTHPGTRLNVVTSRAYTGKPVWCAHPHLRGQLDLVFSDPDEFDPAETDIIFIAAEHGKSAGLAAKLFEDGFDGLLIDLSADFRLGNASLYKQWFDFAHPAPNLLASFVYGLPEICTPYPPGTKRIANPGCFATGISLALWPVTRHMEAVDAFVTAWTGASGSGARPKATTHFPTRDGNVRAYKVLSHQHLPEIKQVLEQDTEIRFVPVSGPWTRGIWGVADIPLPAGTAAADVEQWYTEAYADCPFVRLYADGLPELRFAVHSPFCDIGWIVRDGRLLVGFAEDNLIKGAAGQAIQNLNLLLGLPETTGLLPVSKAPF